MTAGARHILRPVLQNAPLILLVCIWLAFGVSSRRYLSLQSLMDILAGASSVAILAAGMTIVLLTGGIDLSVGAIMFVAAAIAGKLVWGAWGIPAIPVWASVLLIIPIGMAIGAVNAFCIASLRMVPFVVTLAMMFVGRGLALQITETRELKLPEGFRAIGQARLAGIPFSVILLVIVIISAHLLLTRTPFGRHLYAVGNNLEAARKAGINTRRVLAWAYILSGLASAIAGIIGVAELGTVAPEFGWQMEFAAIGAAVLGGTSLFGGRGSILPGTLVGALLIQVVQTGLQTAGVRLEARPIFTAGIIFIAVLIDRLNAAADGSER